MNTQIKQIVMSSKLFKKYKFLHKHVKLLQYSIIHSFRKYKASKYKGLCINITKILLIIVVHDYIRFLDIYEIQKQ